VSAFVDTGVLVAFSNIKDKNHARAVELLQRAGQGEYGAIFSSEYVFDETVTLALMRTKNVSIALSAGELLLGNPEKGIPCLVELLHVDDEIFSASWEFFKRYAAKGLSFTDCTTVALMKHLKIDNLLSFDSSFDGIAKRVC
jgi:predicted nucleic acid-binding protein